MKVQILFRKALSRNPRYFGEKMGRNLQLVTLFKRFASDWSFQKVVEFGNNLNSQIFERHVYRLLVQYDQSVDPEGPHILRKALYSQFIKKLKILLEQL